MGVALQSSSKILAAIHLAPGATPTVLPTITPIVAVPWPLEVGPQIEGRSDGVG